MSGLGGFKFDANGNLLTGGTGTSTQTSGGVTVPNLVPDSVRTLSTSARGVLNVIPAPGLGNRIIIRSYSIVVGGGVFAPTAKFIQAAFGVGIASCQIGLAAAANVARQLIALKDEGMYFPMAPNTGVDLSLSTDDNTDWSGGFVCANVVYNITNAF